MKFPCEVIIVEKDGKSESQTETVTNCHNHIHALMHMAKEIANNEDEMRCDAGETLVVIVKAEREHENEEPWYFGPLPMKRTDARDPYGNTQRTMLADKAGTNDSNAMYDWFQSHPEFELEYLEELQLQERIALKNKLDLQKGSK